MKNSIKIIFALTMAAACFAQTWEVGGAGSYGFYHNATASSPAGSATAGFDKAAGVSVVGGENLTQYLGGEARYLYQFGGPKLEGSQTVTMGGDSHAFSYEFLLYATDKESAIRPFVAAGAGAKLYRGTGPEQAFQPLNGIAIVTRATEFKPLVSVGAGVKVTVSKHGILRFDFRDHTTPFPTAVITPRPPSGRVNGWLHNFVFLAGISATF